MTRESSPPEAVSRSGPGGIPAFGLIISSTVSAPRGPTPLGPLADRDLEPGVRHGQLAQPRPDLRRQARGGLAPRGTELARHFRPARRGPPRARLAAASSAESACSSSSRRCRHASAWRSTAAIAAAVLALQPGEQREPLLHLLEPARRSLDPVQVGAELAAQVLRLVYERLEPLGQWLQRPVDLGRRLERASRRAQQLRHPGTGLGGDRLGRLRGGAAQSLNMPKPVPLPHQPLRLLLARADRLDLAQLERNQVELSLPGPRHLPELLSAGLQAPHVLVQSRHPGPQGLMARPAMGVEDVELGGREHQLAVLVLAVEGEHPASQLPQVGHRGRAAAHVGPGPAVRPHPPGQDDLLLPIGHQLVTSRRARRTRPRRTPRPRPRGRSPPGRDRRAAGRARARAASSPPRSRP